jgi:hypothetical protein
MDFYNSSTQPVKLCQHGFDGNKWPFKQIGMVLVMNYLVVRNHHGGMTTEREDIMKTLLTIIDPSNRPLLVHCNKGKHRTGSIIGCLRKLRGWSLSSIFAEYLQFALPKARLEDQMCIEEFQVDEFWIYAEAHGLSNVRYLANSPAATKHSTLSPSMERSEEEERHQVS